MHAERTNPELNWRLRPHDTIFFIRGFLHFIRTSQHLVCAGDGTGVQEPGSVDSGHLLLRKLTDVEIIAELGGSKMPSQ